MLIFRGVTFFMASRATLYPSSLPPPKGCFRIPHLIFAAGIMKGSVGLAMDWHFSQDVPMIQWSHRERPFFLSQTGCSPLG